MLLCALCRSGSLRKAARAFLLPRRGGGGAPFPSKCKKRLQNVFFYGILYAEKCRTKCAAAEELIVEKIVYLLEDDKNIGELVRCALEMSNVTVECFETVAAFCGAVEEQPPAVAIMDIMLPDGNGLDVLPKLKQKYPSMGVIMLSALGQETDKVRGLNLGADDYIAKPFGVLELTARVNALLRRAQGHASLVRGDLALDEETMTATLRGEKLELNNKEFNLLKYLMQKEGKALTREAILNAVWGYDEGETRTVDNHVSRLRKLGIDYIETVFGVGYKFVYRE